MPDTPITTRFANAYERIARLGQPDVDILDPATSREEVLARIDQDTLRSAPFNLLLSTAMALAEPDALPAMEDAVIRRVAALTDPTTAIASQARTAAELLTISYEDYMACVRQMAESARAAPLRPEHPDFNEYMQAQALHEKKMSRLERTKDSAFNRYQKAFAIYREAILTRDGLDILRAVYAQKANVLEAVDGAIKTVTTPKLISTK